MRLRLSDALKLPLLLALYGITHTLAALFESRYSGRILGAGLVVGAVVGASWTMDRCPRSQLRGIESAAGAVGWKSTVAEATVVTFASEASLPAPYVLELSTFDKIPAESAQSFVEDIKDCLGEPCRVSFDLGQLGSKTETNWTTTHAAQAVCIW